MISVNLIPKSVQTDLRRRRHIIRWAMASLLALAMVALPWGYDWMNRMKADTLAAENQRMQTMLETVCNQLQSLSQHVEETDLKLQRANVLRSKRSWSGMMSLIATALPARSWLTTIVTIPEIPPAATRRTPTAGIKISVNMKENVVTIDAPRKLKLIGYAVDASEPLSFISNLKSYGVFQSVKLQRSYLEPVEDDKYFRFEMICEW